MTDAVRRRVHGHQCIYCGEPSDSDEHFPPKSVNDLGLLLPCCRECNSFAGTEWSFDFEMRVGYVKAKLRKRYRRFLETPEWSDDELSELEPVLRASCRGARLQRDLAIERLAWNPDSYLASLGEETTMADLAAVIDAATLTGDQDAASMPRVR